jgi:hypothetical protein
MDEPVQTRISKLAILSLVLGILSLFFFVLAGIPAIVIGVASILKIRRSAGELKGKYIALAGMNISILFMYVFYLFWSIDAPPIPNDYTVADLRSAPTDCAESFEVLKTLIDEPWSTPGAPAVGLSKHDVDMIDDIRDALQKGTDAETARILSNDSNDIRAAWAASEKARDIIRKLNAFPEIADLSEPEIGSKTMRWHNLIELARLYEICAHLQTEQDDIRAFTIELVELDSVFRKLSLNVRLFIERLICHACLETDIDTANVIVNNPNTSRNIVELLAKQFTPLTAEQLSLRNGLLSEYLLMKNIVMEISHASRAEKTRLVKTNSTLRVYKNYCDDWLTAMEPGGDVIATRLFAWPNHYPFREPDLLSSQGMLPLIYWCYNPLGSKCICTFGFFPNMDFRKRFTMPVHDDLFQIVLNKRLVKEISLKARAYSDEYIVDIGNRKIFSPGPDGKADTKDDIILRINPEVLGWQN